VGYNAVENLVEDPPPNAPASELARQRAMIRFYVFNDRPGARGAWAEQAEPPRDANELAMLAEIEADSGSEAALPYIEQLRAHQPAEADTLLAALRLRQARIPEAAAALEAALVRLRTDPWPVLPLKQKAVDLVAPIAERDAVTARRLFAALREPFAVRAVELPRLMALAALSRRLDFAGLCRIPIGALEPTPPWNAFTLTLRRECYQATSDPRLAVAVRDLERFYAREVVPLAAGVVAR
jgi:hypothetical protein